MKTETRDRKKNTLYLILNYLVEQKLLGAAEALEEEAQLTGEYQVCENVDLNIILQEYQSYYYTKFQKNPKFVRKVENWTNEQKPKTRKKISGKPKICDVKEANASPSESEDFQFEIITLSKDKTEQVPMVTPVVKKEPLLCCDFENCSDEWRELAEDITKEFIQTDLGTKWTDCIGLSNSVEKLKEAAVYPHLYPNVFKNVDTWKGVLLFGPPGTGKTLLAKALASEGSTFVNVTSGAFISKWRGQSEKMIKVLFDLAKRFAPTTIFIDEIDALVFSTGTPQHEASRRFKSELLTQIDGVLSSDANIFLLGATNEPWNVDVALLRRFEKRILVPLPREDSRKDLLKRYITKSNNLEAKDFQKLAQITENFSGSDIKNLGKEVTMMTVRERIRDVESKAGDRSRAELRKITYKDVECALETFKPSLGEGDGEKYQEWNKKFGCW